VALLFLAGSLLISGYEEHANKVVAIKKLVAALSGARIGEKHLIY
jgi:hypothetical protein